MIVAAFDPGKTGAVAICTDDRRGGSWSVDDLPTVGLGKHTIINCAALAAKLRAAGVDYAVIEQVASMPRQGVSSMFKFGLVYGQLIGLVQALEIPHEFVTPARWKGAMRLPGGDGKQEVARQRALELFPALHDRLARKMDHNRAEALLLARWWLEKERRA